MNFNKYNIVIVVRVALIFITLLAVVYFIPKPNRVVTSIFFILLALSQVFLLIRFFTSINRDLARFLIELKEQDSSEIHFPDKLEKKFKNLRYSFQQISNEIQKSRIEKVSQQHYLEYIIENINHGLISFDEDGNIKIINSSAKEILGVSFLNKVWDLDKIYNGLAKKMVLNKPGSQELIKMQVKGNDVDLLFRISEVKIGPEIIKIITFQDVKQQLDEKEIASWKKLMRVLTHEMMNSLTPITTLSVATRRILKKDDVLKQVEEISQEDIQDISKNNDTIETRSKGLLDFIQQYRQITKIPDLKKESVQLQAFFNNIKHLFSEEIESENINFIIDLPNGCHAIEIDKKLIEQVLINLIKNAIESLKITENKKIEIQVLHTGESTIIKIIDNGIGISSEIKNDVFIPFFTTKKQGSGIGLSLSKSIMQKHAGDIYFESEPGKGTVFYLKFQTL